MDYYVCATIVCCGSSGCSRPDPLVELAQGSCQACWLVSPWSPAASRTSLVTHHPYYCHTGQLPFEGADKPAIKEAILRGQMKPLPTSLRPECVSFMSMMLARNPRDRASAHDLLQHPFIRMYALPARAHSGGLAVSKQPMSRRGSKETTVSELKGVQRMSSSNASSGQGAQQTLPLSFSLRHNELADPTVPERMVLKVGATSVFCVWLGYVCFPPRKSQLCQDPQSLLIV